MDPDVVLASLRQRTRKLSKEIDADEMGDGPPLDRGEVEALLEDFKSLDNWLKKGGRLPRAWGKH